MIRVINSPRIVQAAGDIPKKIAEFVGREVSGTDRVSIARMNSPSGWAEPWQLPDFDEYTVVLKGTLEIDTDEGHFEITEGMSVMAFKGSKIRYSTPNGAEYIAVCIPAFSSDIVHREGLEQEILSFCPMIDVKYEIKSYGHEGIDLIEANWTLLREHIINKNPQFADKMRMVKFHGRKTELTLKNKDRDIRILIATSLESGEGLGYCLSSAAPHEYGEIESIFVRKEARNQGIGGELMKMSMNWIKEKGVKDIRVHVTVGNEEVLGFYQRFGLIPRQYILSNPD